MVRHLWNLVVIKQLIPFTLWSLICNFSRLKLPTRAKPSSVPTLAVAGVVELAVPEDLVVRAVHRTTTGAPASDVWRCHPSLVNTK